MAVTPRKASGKKTGGRKYALPPADAQLLRKIGLKIHRDLYELDKPVEWLAFNVGVARSSIREIIAGRSNPRFLTLQSIAMGLGYKSVVDFLRSI